jgi:Family of unknown function (DUF6257)
MIRIRPDDAPLSTAETARLGWLIARMAKRALAGEAVGLSDLQRKADRVIDGARKRAEKAAAAAEK